MPDVREADDDDFEDRYEPEVCTRCGSPYDPADPRYQQPGGTEALLKGRCPACWLGVGPQDLANSNDQGGRRPRRR